uniref:Chaperone DnaJ C-terminal domain-containing protein n=1 Tax=Megaselia scalaris TaxID=36166 RepID=T1GBA8_MEGSC
GARNGSTNNSGFTYQFHGDPRATFAQFFGSSNPFASFFDMGDNLFDKNVFDLDTERDFFSSPFGGLGSRHGLGSPFRSHSFNVHSSFGSKKQQDPPIEHDLYVTLEDIYHGCVKKMRISRRITEANGSTRKEDKCVSINIKPGWKSGTKVTFQKEGDQAPGKIPADICFTIRDKPHPIFKREGSDLRYTARLTLKQALCGVVFQVPTMSGDKLRISTMQEIIKPNTVKRIQGYGLPFPKDTTRKGDLLVAFDIQFPEKLTAAQKEVLRDLL